MGFKQVMEFVKIEHTLFSLPFVLIGYMIALNQFDIDPGFDLFWILLAAIGARGLAMALNRIIDREIDAHNPRTMNRHLVTGTMRIQTAWILAGVFMLTLVISAGMLNRVALMLSWLPVTVFVIYPYLKRYTWLCHFWLGLCLGLAPAGAWVAVAGDIHGWASITGDFQNHSQWLWAPTIFPICLGVAFWISAFDINYARMDAEHDRKHGIRSFPATFSENTVTRTSIQLSLIWFACFAISDPVSNAIFLIASGLMAIANIFIILRRERSADFQTTLFRVSMATGWVLLAALGVSFLTESSA